MRQERLPKDPLPLTRTALRAAADPEHRRTSGARGRPGTRSHRGEAAWFSLDVAPARAVLAKAVSPPLGHRRDAAGSLLYWRIDPADRDRDHVHRPFSGLELKAELF